MALQIQQDTGKKTDSNRQKILLGVLFVVVVLIIVIIVSALRSPEGGVASVIEERTYVPPVDESKYSAEYRGLEVFQDPQYLGLEVKSVVPEKIESRGRDNPFASF